VDVEIDVEVNGERHQLQVEPRLLLAELLRDRLGLTGTKVGCDSTHCGVCTVQLDGAAVKSCTVLAVQADGRTVRTVEGMASGEELHPLQRSFRDHHALQCGYCTPGMLMAAEGLLREHDGALDRAAVRDGLCGNLCRCTGYQTIVDAVLDAQGELREGAEA
jgi:carbon-monoxide dehydrogenase small subunit